MVMVVVAAAATAATATVRWEYGGGGEGFVHKVEGGVDCTSTYILLGPVVPTGARSQSSTAATAHCFIAVCVSATGVSGWG